MSDIAYLILERLRLGPFPSGEAGEGCRQVTFSMAMPFGAARIMASR